MKLHFLNLIFLLFIDISCIDLDFFNSSGIYASDNDIIGAYKIMTGNCISLEQFIYYKSLKDKKNWTLKDLGNFYISLDETKKFLEIPWLTPTCSYSKIIPSYTEDIKKSFQVLKNLDKSNNLTDADIIAAYRTMTGHSISSNTFERYQKLKNLHSISLKNLAIYIMAEDDSQINLNIPILESTEIYPLRIHNGPKIFGYKTDYVIAKTISQTGYWEPHMESLMNKIIKKDDVVIDVGANIGYFTAILSKLVGKNGKVFAFEPVKPFAQLITKLKQVNNFRQIMVYSCALSDKPGKVFIKVNTISPGTSKFTTPQDAFIQNSFRPGSVIEVSMHKLDDIFLKMNINKIDFIKIDVEGAEPLVLEGAKKIIEKFHPKITCEFNLGPYKEKGINPLNFLMQLHKLGYRIAIVSKIANLSDPESLGHQKWVQPRKLIEFMNERKMIQIDIFLKWFSK